MTSEYEADIRRWIDETVTQLNASSIPIRWSWCSAFTNRMGEACYSKQGNGSGLVRFSKPLWPRASEEQRRQTVIHEVCHIVDHYRKQHDPSYGLARPRGPHGASWQKLMRECGLEPKRTHNVDRTGLHRRVTRIQMQCGCPNGIQITVRAHQRMLSGAKAQCRRCGQLVRFPSPHAAFMVSVASIVGSRREP